MYRVFNIETVSAYVKAMKFPKKSYFINVDSFTTSKVFA